MNPYQKLLSRKRSWTPVQVEAGTFAPGSEEAMLRALSVRNLEIPVGDFIKNALKKDYPAAAQEVLESNIKDEEKHDLALDYPAPIVDEKTARTAAAAQIYALRRSQSHR